MRDDILRSRAEAYHAKFDAELGGEYERLTDFKGSHEMLSARHIPCGEIRTAAARDFFRKGCPICDRLAAQKRRAQRRAEGYIKKIETEYDVTAITEYTEMRDPITWRCNKCGAVMERTVENILFRKGPWGGGIRCDCQIETPDYVVSAGALEIIEHLRERRIPYMREVRFETCRMKRPLPFDFVLYDDEGQPLGIIEYNGQQHYEPLEMFGGEDGLKRRMAADTVKAEWCAQNEIPLLIIRYDEDIAKALEQFINSI